MFQGFVLGLTAAVTLGVADIVAVVVARRIGTMSILVWTHIGGLAVSTSYLLLVADLKPISFVYLPALGALVFFILLAMTSFYKAIQTVPVSLVSPIISANLVIVILLSAALLGDRLGTVQLLAISMAFIGVALTSMTPGDLHPGGDGLRKGIVLAVTAMLSAGVFLFGIGSLSKELGWFLPLYLVRAGTFGVLLPTHLAMRGLPSRRLPSRSAFIAALVGVLQFAGIGAYMMGTSIAPISIVAASFSVYPIIPVIGGLVFFGERLVSRQAMGVVTALVGLVVLGLVT